MTPSILHAVGILDLLWKQVQLDDKLSDAAVAQADRILLHAIQHITRPERDIYPKVRNSRKRNPITKGVR